MAGLEPRPQGSARSAKWLALALAPALVVSISQSAAKEAGFQIRKAQPAATPAAQSAPVRTVIQPAIVRPASSPEAMLEQRIRSIGAGFNGDIGIAVKDIQTGFVTAYDGHTYFPQQSVSKFWVALTALDRVDRGLLNLGSQVTVTKSDLTLFHQPIARQVGANGYTTTLNSLMTRALQQSDNTCNDFVLWKSGGPEAVRSFLAAKNISGIRFGPGERVMQSRIAGMEWKPSYVGANFYAARNQVPMNVRRAAFQSYVKDPVDGATPIGIVDALARLQQGELLSAQSTRKLLDIMSNTRTGPQRLKGGLSSGWKLAHKTGTGQVLGGTQAGYNDIGIVTGPDGRSYAVAVMIRKTAAPIPERMRAMQNVTRAVIDYAQAVPAQRFARQAPKPIPAPAPALPDPARVEVLSATVASLDEAPDEQ